MGRDGAVATIFVSTIMGLHYHVQKTCTIRDLAEDHQRTAPAGMRQKATMHDELLEYPSGWVFPIRHPSGIGVPRIRWPSL